MYKSMTFISYMLVPYHGWIFSIYFWNGLQMYKRVCNQIPRIRPQIILESISISSNSPDCSMRMRVHVMQIANSPIKGPGLLYANEQIMQIDGMQIDRYDCNDYALVLMLLSAKRPTPAVTFT